MSQTLELSLASTRRHFQATTTDVEEWTQANDTNVLDKAKALSRAVDQVVAYYQDLNELDQMFRSIAGNARPNAEAAGRAVVLSAQFADYVDLVEATMRSIDDLPRVHQPPKDRLDKLRELKAAAEEAASVYRGEAEYFRGDLEVSWEEFRQTIGV
jgi:hypothetical protein